MDRKPKWEDPEIREFDEMDEGERPVVFGGCRPGVGFGFGGFGFGGCRPSFGGFGGCFPRCNPSFNCNPAYYCRPRYW